MGAFLERLASSVRELCADREGPVAVAVSGGVDSTVLLRSLHRLGTEVIALHVDHGLREDAEADAAFVLELARAIGVPAAVLRAEVGDGNRQQEARNARYSALARAARRHGCSVLMTGHTATDQAETVLMHLVRGAGLRGLAGMAPRRTLPGRVELVRPMLWATRAEVEAEARSQGWGWREDPSNATDVYRRNRLRQRVLPLLEEEGGPGTAARIAASASAVRAALPALEAYAHSGERALDADALRAAPDRIAVWAEALAAWVPGVRRTQNLLRQLDALVAGQVGRHVPVGDLVAWRDRDAVRIVAPAESIDRVIGLGETARTELGALELATLNAKISVQTPPDPAYRAVPLNIVLFDADALGGTLRLRTWQAGDRIEPHGLEGSKLVSDVLRERRVRPSERDRQLVLCVGDRVAWVVGHRLAAWAGMSEASRQLVRAEWVPRLSVR